MTIKLLERRLEKIQNARLLRSIVIEVPVGESLDQARDRAQVEYGDFSSRLVVFIVRTQG